jgi:hypothetical protein
MWYNISHQVLITVIMYFPKVMKPSILQAKITLASLLELDDKIAQKLVSKTKYLFD